jgi:hypothetical protein
MVSTRISASGIDFVVATMDKKKIIRMYLFPINFSKFRCGISEFSPDRENIIRT